jgi:hypothetical protein
MNDMKTVYVALLPIVLLGFTALVGAAYSLWRAKALDREEKARAMNSASMSKETVQVSH